MSYGDHNRKGPGRPPAYRAYRNFMGRMRRRLAIKAGGSHGRFAGEEIQEIVRGMTNKQRNEWAKRGYPTKLVSLRSFAGLDK